MYRDLLTRRAVLAFAALVLGACESVTGPTPDLRESRAASRIAPEQAGKVKASLERGRWAQSMRVIHRR